MYGNGSETYELVMMSDKRYGAFVGRNDEGAIAFDIETETVLGLVFAGCVNFGLVTPWKAIETHFLSTYGMNMRWKPD